MSRDQQSTAAEPSERARPSSEKVVSRNEPTIPVSMGHQSSAKERLASRQATLDQHRGKVVQDIAALNVDLEKVPDTDVTKRLSARKKIKAAEDQLAMIAEEQASLDSEKKELAKAEEQARVEEAARTR